MGLREIIAAICGRPVPEQQPSASPPSNAHDREIEMVRQRQEEIAREVAILEAHARMIRAAREARHER